MARRHLRARRAVVSLVALAAGLLGGCSRSSDPYADLPSARSDLVRVVESAVPASAGRTLPGDAGLFVGPHFAIRLHSVGVVPAVDQVQASLLDIQKPFRAALGHEIVLAKVDLEPIQPRWGTEPAPRADIVAGTRVTPLDAVPGPGDLIVASVPEGSPAILRVTDAGQAHSFDLRSGDRGDDPPGRTYPVRRAPLPADLYDATGTVHWAGVDQKVHVIMTAPGGSASLEPYLPGAGWARPGRAWLLLTPLQVVSTTAEYFVPGQGYVEVAFEVSPPRSFALRLPDGSLVRAEPTSRIRTQAVPEPSAVSFDVPASLHRARLVITPNGPMATIAGPSSLQQFANLNVSGCGTAEIPCLRWGRPPRPRVIPMEIP